LFHAATVYRPFIRKERQHFQHFWNPVKPGRVCVHCGDFNGHAIHHAAGRSSGVDTTLVISQAALLKTQRFKSAEKRCPFARKISG
jgi:hypothetical protein